MSCAWPPGPTPEAATSATKSDGREISGSTYVRIWPLARPNCKLQRNPCRHRRSYARHTAPTEEKRFPGAAPPPARDPSGQSQLSLQPGLSALPCQRRSHTHRDHERGKHRPGGAGPDDAQNREPGSDRRRAGDAPAVQAPGARGARQRCPCHRSLQSHHPHRTRL